MDVKMPMAPVTSANSQLILIGTLFNHCAFPQPSGALAVVGMNGLQPTKIAHLVFVLSGKLLPTRVNKETLSPRVRPPHHLGARHHQRAVPGLALAQRLLFVLALLDQSRQQH
jgi:hypothetical protein